MTDFISTPKTAGTSTETRWLVEQAVQFLLADWSSREVPRRPWGSWMVLWGAITSDADLDCRATAPPLLAAWFLTDSGFVRHDVWSYWRHHALMRSALHSPLATRVGTLEVAPYRHESAVYAAGHYGPRDAYGLRLERAPSGQMLEERLWYA